VPRGLIGIHGDTERKGTDVHSDVRNECETTVRGHSV